MIIMLLINIKNEYMLRLLKYEKCIECLKFQFNYNNYNCTIITMDIIFILNNSIINYRNTDKIIIGFWNNNKLMILKNKKDVLKIKKLNFYII